MGTTHSKLNKNIISYERSLLCQKYIENKYYFHLNEIVYGNIRSMYKAHFIQLYTFSDYSQNDRRQRLLQYVLEEKRFTFLTIYHFCSHFS